MKKAFFYIFISFSTFFVGLFCAGFYFSPVTYSQVTLEEITANSEYYDGRNVEITTYASLFMLEDKGIIIGEPFEKEEVIAHLDLEENSVDAFNLQEKLSVNFTHNNYKRIKVKVTGKLEDNCNKGIPCCFGRSFKIITKSITPIGQVEDYTVPLKFQLDESKFK